MAIKEVWQHFQSTGYMPKSDEELLSMIQDVADTIGNLRKMFPNHGASLVISGLIPTYLSLQSVAYNRNLKNIPELP